MVASVDGKVTGDFLYRPECEAATEIYYRLNREYKESGAQGFICGRVTMEQSFTGGFYPDLSAYEPLAACELGKSFIPERELSGFYAVAFDTHGSLGWRSSRIIDPDGDPGYDGAEIIEVLSENVDTRYLSYLRELGIPYIFAGKESVDVSLALSELNRLIGCKRLILEGGSIINGAFLRSGAVDELSLVVAPVIAGEGSKPLFSDATVADFKLRESTAVGDVLLLKYGR